MTAKIMATHATPETENCLFCRIIKGEIPSSKIYEDEYTFAFLDIAPFREGHCLVIPKIHAQNILDIDSALAPYLFKTIQNIAPAIMKATSSQGFHILQNNFAAAGQTVFHAHWHIIPRSEGDNFPLWTQTPYENEHAIRNMARTITNLI